jgi:hypothetical protein
VGAFDGTFVATSGIANADSRPFFYFRGSLASIFSPIWWFEMFERFAARLLMGESLELQVEKLAFWAPQDWGLTLGESLL